jgi:NAD(P)H-flavin reductase/ferredoxin
MEKRHQIRCIFEDGRTVVIRATEGDTLYAAALRQGTRLLTDCREGACATCFARCVSGSFWHGDISEEALGSEAASGGVLPCQLHLTSDAVVEFPYTLEDARPELTRTARILATEQVAQDVFRLALALSEPFDFLPGQYVRLAVPGTNATRAYSMANRAGAAELEFFVRLLPGGAMSTWLHERAQPGDPLDLTGPFGRFYLRPTTGQRVMVAGGTGLAPMLAMLESLAAEEGHTGTGTTLLYGVNDPRELFGVERVKALVPNIDLRLSVLNPSPDWQGETGFVTNLLTGLPLSGADVYLCGPPPMIDAAQTSLSGQDCRVFAERFLPA